MASEDVKIADALAAAARSINSPTSVEATLDAIVETAKASLHGIDHVGVSISHRDGRIETMSGTDQLVWELDALQYELHEGPCDYAVRSEQRVVVMEHARDEKRWPRYVPRAVELGLRSQMGLQLYVEDLTLGGLNLYSTSSDTIDAEVVHIAELFAAHAALALGKAREVGELMTGMIARKTIGQAIGIIMERHQITEDRAFAFLSRASQTSNIKLRDIAQEVVETAQRRGERPQADA